MATNSGIKAPADAADEVCGGCGEVLDNCNCELIAEVTRGN